MNIENKNLKVNKKLENNKYNYSFFFIKNNQIYKISNKNKYNNNIYIYKSSEKILNKYYNKLL